MTYPLFLGLTLRLLNMTYPLFLGLTLRLVTLRLVPSLFMSDTNVQRALNALFPAAVLP